MEVQKPTIPIYYSRDGDNLQMFSCTDITCVWKKEHQEVLKKYEPKPLAEHSCFKKPEMKEYSYEMKLTSDQLKEIITSKLPESAFAKDV